MVILDKNEYNFKYYSIKLGEDYQISGKPVLGIVTFSGTDSFRSTFSKLIPRFADPNIFYKPIFNDAATEFIYYLLWWIMLINISMAAANMLPVGIFDGGRFYMLSFFALTKNMGLSQRIFKITTYIILALLGVGTLFWFFSIIGLR
jgi:membrane-associated protease RseP (regulator of RpoE activity)